VRSWDREVVWMRDSHPGAAAVDVSAPAVPQWVRDHRITRGQLATLLCPGVDFEWYELVRCNNVYCSIAGHQIMSYAMRLQVADSIQTWLYARWSLSVPLGSLSPFYDYSATKT
jgi:hypothetical protein